MSFKQETQFIQGLEKLKFNAQDLAIQEQKLNAWQNHLGAYLRIYAINTEGLKTQHPLSKAIGQFHVLKTNYLLAWEQAKKDLVPALDLAASFNDKLMFLVFGKFNAGKSSFCNLIAERFKFHQKTVQPFILKDGAIHYHDEAFKEGSIETTAHIQGVILDERLVLIDTPGLHSITSENAALTQQFLESADGILWLSSSTSPGQVQELQELAQEIRRRKPLLPVITRSDFLDEVFVDNDIKKMLCNKSPENRSLQENDVLSRAQKKLNSLGMDATLVRQPISISVYSAREYGLTDQALADAGLYQLYEALLNLADSAVAYKERKALEILLHYLDEVVINDLNNLILQIEELKQLINDETAQITKITTTIKNRLWQNALAKLPYLMDSHLKTSNEEFHIELKDKLNSDLKLIVEKHLSKYEIDKTMLATEIGRLLIKSALTSEHYEKFYLAVEETLQTQLNNIANLLKEQCESILNTIEEQLTILVEQLEQQKYLFFKLKLIDER